MTLADTDWLSTEGAATVVTSSVKLEGERARARTMAGTLAGKQRVWATDGQYVYFRRRKAHEGTLTRHARFMESGHYKHIATEDDVEIYELQDGSPFKRQGLDLLSIDVATLRRAAVMAACGRDYGLYVDIISELASRVKGATYSDGKPAQPGFAEELYQSQLSYIFRLIEIRGGPTVPEVNRGVANTRVQRGDTRSKVILLPAGMA